ncbi:unnamed protein product [Meloidogyne enterolobii]|uniref:Uncharacterized protein n=1 Tax=Meloidogyne enterolobii TaxID=390850 RepID=A0ACB1B2T2_MELEN
MEEIQNEEDEDEKALNVLNKQLTNLKSVNSQFFQQFEGNIKSKTEWQKCLNYVLLLKIFVKNKLKMEEIKNIIFGKLEKECKLNDKKVDKEIEKLYQLVKEKNVVTVKELKNLENNLNKLFKEFKEIIGQIENKNQLMEYFEELKSIEKKSEEKGRRVEIIEKMDNLVNGENIEDFDERLKNKYEFLVKNWEKLFLTKIHNEEEKNIFYKQILPESEKIKKEFKNSGPLFVKYCLTKRIENSFNKDGTVKFSDFLSNGVGQEYGWELNEVLGQKRIDIGYYENIEKQIKEELKYVCEEDFEENFKNNCELFLEHELQYWHSFCSIDTEHLRFERFEEMKVVTNNYRNKEDEEKKDSFEKATFDKSGDVSKSEEIEDAIKKTTSDEVKGDDAKSEGEIQVL